MFTEYFSHLQYVAVSMECLLKEDLLFLFLGRHCNIPRKSQGLKELSCVTNLDNNSSKCKLVRIFFQIPIQ